MLVEQVLDVLHEQQDEHEQDELVAAISPSMSNSSISKVIASSSRSSVFIGFLPSICRSHAHRPGRVAQPPPQPVLVLVEQQLDVLHELQELHEQLELHQPAAS